MNDSAPKKSRSKARSQKKKSGISKTHQSLIGVFVFAFGLAAVIAVLYLAIAKYSGSNEGIEEEVPETRAGQTLAEKSLIEQKMKTADFEDIVGRWYVEYDLKSAYVTINANKTFEIIVFMDPNAYERRLGRGSVEFNNDTGIAFLRSSYDPLPDSETGLTKSLTRRDYKIVMMMDKGDQNMYWVPHVIPNMRDQVHPMFINLDREDSFIKWVRAKS